MAVKDVFTPKSTNPIDPQSAKEKEEGKESEWQRKAKDAKAEREYLEEQKRIDRIGQPEQPKEPAFGVEGKVKLDIDPQRDARETREAAERIREQAEKDKKEREGKIEELVGKLDESKRELEDTKMTAAMKAMTGSFNAALKDMNDKLEEVKAGADPSAMVNQFKVLNKLSEEMASMKGTPGVGDSALQLEITKLQMENARAEREFQARMEQDRRQWELDKEKMQDDRYFKQQDVARQEKRDEMFASFPQRIGGAIAKGMIESGEGGGISERSKGKQPGIVAGVGEAGETTCGNCGRPIAIGPTARVAVCANCGTSFPIKRVQQTSESEEE